MTYKLFLNLVYRNQSRFYRKKKTCLTTWMLHPYRCYVCSLRLNRIVKEDCKRRSENKITLSLPLLPHKHTFRIPPNWNNGNVFHTHTHSVIHLSEVSWGCSASETTRWEMRCFCTPSWSSPAAAETSSQWGVREALNSVQERVERNFPRLCHHAGFERKRELYTGLNAVFMFQCLLGECFSYTHNSSIVTGSI